MNLEVERARLETATAGLDAPFAVLDMNSVESNQADMRRRAAGKPIRIASKSLRCRSVLTELLKAPGYAGVLAFTLPEALWLATASDEYPALDDIVVAYPTVNRTAIAALASDQLLADRITLMVDDPAQLYVIETARPEGGAVIRVAIDIDASWRPIPGSMNSAVHIGARRSPVRTPDQAVALTRQISQRDGLRLVGAMSYEAQIAGLGNRPPHKRVRGLAITAMQSGSARELVRRRGATVAAIRNELERLGQPTLEFVNGGGTGSLEISAADSSLTELAAGSGFYAPTLFDGYRHFHLDAGATFALPVVRRPGPETVTVLGGGYIASGIADPSRLPQPWLPTGLKLDSQEGAGEVQTPLRGEVADKLAIGDLVWFRHAKAGELCERFAQLLMIRGSEIVGTVNTYRGDGQTFL